MDVIRLPFVFMCVASVCVCAVVLNARSNETLAFGIFVIRICYLFTNGGCEASLLNDDFGEQLLLRSRDDRGRFSYSE